jgi:sensor histidine kinase YesM
MKSKIFNSIGLKNVDRRIKLNCGEEYGIVISSEKNKFTKVKLILPIIKEQVNY